MAELADAQDLGWFPTKPREESKALSFGSHGVFSFLLGIVWAHWLGLGYLKVSLEI